MKKIKSAVLLIAFNRPELTEKVLTQLREIKPSKLYIAIDGARNKQDQYQIEKVKQVIKTIDWGCELKTNFASKNYGCKYGPIRAIDWLFKNEDRGIILEDDILADKSFFFFADQLLEKYINEKKIGSISGNNFTNSPKTKKSYMFSKYSQTWGWATWRRVWDKYDLHLKDWPQKRDNKWLHSVLNNTSSRLYWKIIFNAVYKEEINSAWDYQWTYMSWKNNLLTIIPKKNLATNIGIGVTGATHTKVRGKLYDYPKYEVDFPLKHPNKIESNKKLDIEIQKSYVLWKELAMNIVRKFHIIKKQIFC